MTTCIKKFWWPHISSGVHTTRCIIPSPCCGQNLVLDGKSHMGLGCYGLTFEDCRRRDWLISGAFTLKKSCQGDAFLLAWKKANTRLPNCPQEPWSKQIRHRLGAKTTDKDLGYALTRMWILLTAGPRRGPPAPGENYRWREDSAELHLSSTHTRAPCMDSVFHCCACGNLLSGNKKLLDCFPIRLLTKTSKRLDMAPGLYVVH